MKKPKKGKARQGRRRSTRTRSRRKSAREPRIEMITMGYDGQNTFIHDDCPHCVALREMGLDGNGSMTMDQYAAYQARTKVLIEEHGMNGGVRMTGEQMTRQFEWIATRLAAEGLPVDVDEVPDDRLLAYMQRVTELSREYETLN